MSAFLSAMWEDSAHDLSHLRAAVARYRNLRHGENAKPVEAGLSREALFDELCDHYHSQDEITTFRFFDSPIANKVETQPLSASYIEAALRKALDLESNLRDYNLVQEATIIGSVLSLLTAKLETE